MNPIIAVIAVVIVGILLSTGTAKKSSPPKTEAGKSVSPTFATTPNPSPTNEATVTPHDIIPKVIPTNIPMPQSNTNSSNSQPNSNGWQYPGSSGGGGSYTTSDDPNTVTNWYKQKIENNGMNTTSYVTNSVNGNINNQLVGSNGSSQVKVSITKGESDSQTKISVSF